MSASKKKRMGSHRRSLNANVQETPEVSGTAKSPPVAQGKPKEDAKSDLLLSPDTDAQSEIQVRKKKLGSQRSKVKQQFQEVGDSTTYSPPPVSDEMDILGFTSESLQKIDKPSERNDSFLAQKSETLSDVSVNVDVSPETQPTSSKSLGSSIKDIDVEARSDWLLENVQSKTYLPEIDITQEGVSSEKDQAKGIPSIPETSFAAGVTEESTSPGKLIEQEEISDPGSHDTNYKHSTEQVGHSTEKPVCQELSENSSLTVASIKKLGSTQREKERKNEELLDQGEDVVVDTNAFHVFNLLETAGIKNVQHSQKVVSFDIDSDVATDVKDQGQLEVHAPLKEETGSNQINDDISVISETNTLSEHMVSEDPQVEDFHFENKDDTSAPVESLPTDITVRVKEVTATDSPLIGNRKLGSSRKTKGRRRANDEAKQEEIPEENYVPDKYTEVEPVSSEQIPVKNIFNESIGRQEVDESFIAQVHIESGQYMDDTIEGNISTNNAVTTSVKAVQSDSFQNIFEWAASKVSHEQLDNAISDAPYSLEHDTTSIQVSQESSSEPTEAESVHSYAIFSTPNEQVNLHQLTFLDDNEVHEKMDDGFLKTGETSQTHPDQDVETQIIQTDVKHEDVAEEKDITKDQFFKTTEITSSFKTAVQQKTVKHVTFQNDDLNFGEDFFAAEYKDETFGGSHLSSAELEVQLEKSPITEVIFSKEEAITEPEIHISTEKQLDFNKSEDDGNNCSVESTGPEEASDKKQFSTKNSVGKKEFSNLELDPDTDGVETAPVQVYKEEHQEKDVKLEQLVDGLREETSEAEEEIPIEDTIFSHKLSKERGSTKQGKTTSQSEIYLSPKQQMNVDQICFLSDNETNEETDDSLTPTNKTNTNEQEINQSTKQPVHVETIEEHSDTMNLLGLEENDGHLFSLKPKEASALVQVYTDEDQEREVKLSDEESTETDVDRNAVQACPQTDNAVSVEDVTDSGSKFKDNDESKQGDISEEDNRPISDATIETTQTVFVAEEQGPNTAVEMDTFDEQEFGQKVDNSSVELPDELFVAHEDTALKKTDMPAIFETAVQDQTVDTSKTKDNDISEHLAGDQSDITKMPHEKELFTKEKCFTEETKVDSQSKIDFKPKEQIDVHQITFLSDNEMHEDMDRQPDHNKTIREPSETPVAKALDTDPHHGPSRRKLGSSRRTKARKPAPDVAIDVSENSITGNEDMFSNENKDEAKVTQFVQRNLQEVYGHNLATEVPSEEHNVKHQDTGGVVVTEDSTIKDKQEFFSSSDKKQTTDTEPCNQNVSHQEDISTISKNENGSDQEKDSIKVKVELSNDEPINQEIQKQNAVIEVDNLTVKDLKVNVYAEAEHVAVGIDSTRLQSETTTRSQEVDRADSFDATQICAMSHAEDIAKDQHVTQDMEVLEASEKLEIALEKKRRKMGSTRRSQLNKKQDEEATTDTEDPMGVIENSKITNDTISTENDDAKSLSKDIFENQQETTKAANTITVELHSQEGKEIPALVQEGKNEEAATVVDMAATQNLHLVTGDEIQPSSPGKRRKMGSTRKNLSSKLDPQEKTTSVVNIENKATVTDENNESKEDSGLLLHSVPKQQDDETDLGQRTGKETLNSESEEADMSSKSDAITEEALVARKRKMGSHRKPQTEQSKRQDVHNENATEDSLIQPLREDSSKLDQMSQVKESSNKAIPTVCAFDIKAESRPFSEKPEQPSESPAPEHRIRLSSGFGHRASLGSSSYEVVMIGDSSVGKTSFMQRGQTGKFASDLPASVGLDAYILTVMVDAKPVALHLWDTAGQERFHSMTKQIFHRAQAFLLMYDVTCSQSFAAVSYWANCIKEGASENVVTLLLGNKSDCKDRTMTRDDGEILAQEHNFAFMECSAATGENVMEALETVARLLSQRAAAREEPLLLRKPEPRNKLKCC